MKIEPNPGGGQTRDEAFFTVDKLIVPNLK
jgi:hypothetical protein